MTVHRGALFNPWVNITVCVICTLGLAGATWWAVSQYVEIAAAQPYPDQGLDTAGTIIGIVFFGLATICLFVCTILTIRWWAIRIREDREQQDVPAEEP